MIKSRGFTLIEVVISIAIMAIILSVSYRGVTSIAEAKLLLDDQRDSIQIANVLLSRFTRELQMAVSDTLLSDEYNKQRFFGQNRRNGDNDSDLIAFMASSAGQFVPGGETHSGTVQISIQAMKDPELTGKNLDTLVLIRDEMPNIKPPEKAVKTRITFPLTRNLVSLDFAYYDFRAKQWQEDWQDAQRLPAMVRIKISLKTERGEVMTFQTAVPIKAGTA